ncbi:MAG: sigma-54-dependent Fis family transcriptional regulator, partial [Candidatus Tectomicrobia bacterium]|nr:sigma-54-dependent Fis family transcriptional regulator [Candidatus Tectomicrobia bacterium]
MNKQNTSSLSILVVDDEADMRLALSAALGRAGCEVEAVSSGLEALYKLEKRTYDVVISDVRMPHVSGLDVLRKAKEHNPQVSFIMITAYGTIENAVEAMREGATDYILKPFSVEILEDAVRRVWKRKGPRVGKEEPAGRSQEVPLKGE